MVSLEPFCWFLGDADLPQLVTRLSEYLTNGRTFTSCKFCCTRSACKQASTRSLARISLSLNPKINRVQTVSFNGAGVSLTSLLYAIIFAKHAYGYWLQKVIRRWKRNGTVSNTAESPADSRPLCEVRPNIVRQLYFPKMPYEVRSAAPCWRQKGLQRQARDGRVILPARQFTSRRSERLVRPSAEFFGTFCHTESTRHDDNKKK